MSAPCATLASDLAEIGRLEWLTTDQAARLAGVKRGTIHWYCRRAQFVRPDVAMRPRELYITRPRGNAWIEGKSFREWLRTGMPCGKGAW